MSRSFHVTRTVVRREVLLIHAEDEAAARRSAGQGQGEMLDSTDEITEVNAEETAHSKRRRVASRVAAIPAAVEMSQGDGREGDDVFTGSGCRILDTGEDPPPQPPAPTPRNLFVGSFPKRGPLADGYGENTWRDLHAGEIPGAGDEYRLNARFEWEPVTQSLIGHAISLQARAQFRSRRRPA